MEIFSEIYGQYYRIMSSLLKNDKLSLIEMSRIVHELGFGETDSYFKPDTEEDTWLLFNKNNSGEYEPIVDSSVNLPPTALEKAWLRAILEDPRMQLFLTEDELARAKEKMQDIKPLYNTANIINFDQFDIGDDYSSPSIQKHFSLLLEAMKISRAVKISYLSAKGKELEGVYVPCKFEYSQKNDKIRCLVVQIENGECRDYTILNLARICDVKFSEKPIPKDCQEYFTSKRNRSEQYIEVELSDERNAMERFMVEFSNYRREAIYDKERDILKVTMWYDGLDGTEILVKLLGFGPVLKVVGPDSFVELIKGRLLKQRELNK